MNNTSWKSWAHWRRILLYFLAFSFIGHFIEMGWTLANHFIIGKDLSYNILANPLEPYTIYGAGAVLLILIIPPLLKKIEKSLKNVRGKKFLSVGIVFVLTTLLCAVLEYLSSIVLFWRYGYNPYWCYIDRSFNLGGHIWLGNVLLFGLIATFFIKTLMPLCDKLLVRAKPIFLHLALVLFIAIFAYHYIFTASGF